MIEAPVDGEGRAGAGSRGDVKWELVDDATESGAVVGRDRVQTGDGEGHGKRGEEGEGGGGGEEMHGGVVDEARHVVGIVRVVVEGIVWVVVMVGVFGRVEAWGGECDFESGEGGAEAGLTGDGSGMGAEREGCVVTFVFLFSRSFWGRGGGFSM